MLNPVSESTALLSVTDIPFLPLVRYRLTFEAVDRVVLPAFAGPLWRSVLGPQLKQKGEMLFRHFYSVETPPWIISTPLKEASEVFEPGENFGLDFTLIGEAVSLSGVVIECLDLAAGRGLGPDLNRGRLVDVATVWREDGETAPVNRSAVWPEPQSPVIPPMPPVVRIVLMSPMSLRMKTHPGDRSDRKLMVRARQFRAFDLFDKLVRRVSTLMAAYGGRKLETDFVRLRALGQDARIRDDFLVDHDRIRWSSRQGQEVPIGGVTGTFSLDMAGLAPLWPFLWLGQWTHAGKNTVMGCGAYQIFPE